MFGLNQGLRFYLYNAPTDMRKSFDGLSGLIQNNTDYNLLSGDVFVFVNRMRNKMKLLRWEHGGFILYYKRLERGTFEASQDFEHQITKKLDYSTLVMMVNGISTRNIKYLKRYG
jgi:transposase